jgi:hypothetical protein
MSKQDVKKLINSYLAESGSGDSDVDKDQVNSLFGKLGFQYDSYAPNDDGTVSYYSSKKTAKNGDVSLAIARESDGTWDVGLVYNDYPAHFSGWLHKAGVKDAELDWATSELKDVVEDLLSYFGMTDSQRGDYDQPGLPSGWEADSA